MKLYNSLSRSLEPFEVENNRVGVYVCGITPYDTTHLGHAFTFLTYDVLVRYLRYKGYEVTYIQNVTDIDDDILRKSRELDVNWEEFGREETNRYLQDMHDLNAIPFDHYTAATQHIPEMLTIIEELLDLGFAYEVNGSVYFSVEKADDFGKLSHLDLQEMLPIANQRGNNPDDPNKKNPLDFVLWQAAKPGEPTWETSWGPGRPGWHIECTAMAQKYLGDTFAIHGGGYDLIFPHHECEIAQAENATGKEPYVRYWMHAAMVDYQGEKMSKSLGNLVYVRQLLQHYCANAIRLALLDNHYRARWEFFDDKMPEYEARAQQLADAMSAESGDGVALDVSGYREQFFTAMEDDLNTPVATAAVLGIASAILDNPGANSQEAQSILRELAWLLGIVL